MRAEWRDSLEHVYPDSVVGERPRRSVKLDVARGGTAAVHVLATDLQAGGTLRVSVRQSGRAVRSAHWFRLIDVPVEVNTGPVGFVERDDERNEYVTRRAPFHVYDAMATAGSRIKVAAETMAMRLHLPVAEDARAGRRQYEVVVAQGREEVGLTMQVDVHRVKLPAVGRSSWPYTNWFSYELIAQRHGLKMWSEGYWQMLGRYAKLMAHGRQNTFWVPLGTIFRPTARGAVLDEQRLRRIVKVFSAAGMHIIEGGHWATRTGGQWLSKTFDLTIGRPPEAPAGRTAIASSREAALEMAFAADQLMTVIEKQRWQDRWLQHVADEPIDINATDYRLVAGLVRRFMPGIPILDATMEQALVGSVDCWCPQAQWYQKQRKHFEQMKQLGDRVWFYTCCFPGGPWLNRLLDMELVRPALFGWAAALYGLDGFLHWGLNHYRPEQNPFEQSAVDHGGVNRLPAGDTHIVYPGDDGPWSSLRLEAQREGIEDYELLRMLAQRSGHGLSACGGPSRGTQRGRPHAAATITRSVIRGFDRYTKDVAVLRGARRRVLAALCVS